MINIKITKPLGMAFLLGLLWLPASMSLSRASAEPMEVDQSTTVSSRIVDANGEPIQGAVITEIIS